MLPNADLVAGKVAGNEQLERGAGEDLGSELDGDLKREVEEKESWVGAVRIPGDEESELVRDEVMGA